MITIFRHDHFTHLSQEGTGIATVAALDALKNSTPEQQVAAMGAAFLLLCESYKVAAQDAFTVIKNVINGAHGPTVEFNAARMFIENDIVPNATRKRMLV